MKAPRAPRLDERRTEEFAAELHERAQAWIPAWGLADGEGDFGRALLQIAARFSSEVAERLDGAGDKMRRGFLDWLGVARKAARPARLPVVFKLADAASEAVLAPDLTQMRADAAGTPVMFETESGVRVIPGRLEVVVGVDAESDAFYLPPPGLSDLQPLESLPTQWRVKSFAAAAATKIQLDPELGLARGMILAANGQQYTIVSVEKDLVTIDPPLVAELAQSTLVAQVTTFAPFDGAAHNWQDHALYLGDAELLNIEAAATIEVVGAGTLRTGYSWEYSGKSSPNAEVSWLPLAIAESTLPAAGDSLALTKPTGAIEPKAVNGQTSRWIRAYARTIDPASPPFTSDQLGIRVNASGCSGTLPCPPAATTASPAAEAMTNTTPLVLDNVFYPLGREPRQFDAFYLGSQEAFSKRAAHVQLCFEMADQTFTTLAAVRQSSFGDAVLAGVAKDRALHLLLIGPTTGAVDGFRNRGPLQPPQPGFLGNTEAGRAVPLDAQPSWRLPVWSEFDPYPNVSFAGFLVGASAGDSIWIWRELVSEPQRSGWINFGTLPPASTPATSGAGVDGLVFLAGPSKIAALRGERLYLRDWPAGAQWVATPTSAGSSDVKLRSIVPILVENPAGGLVTSTADGMLGVDARGELFRVAADGACTRIPATGTFDHQIRPVVIKDGASWNVAAASKPSGTAQKPKLVAFRVDFTTVSPTVSSRVEVEVAEVLAALEGLLITTPSSVNKTFHVLATVRDGSERRLVTWAPFETAPDNYAYQSPAFGDGLMQGAPVAIGRFVVVPGARSDLLVSEFDPSRRRSESATIETGVVVRASLPTLAPGDLVVRSGSGQPVSSRITGAGLTKDGEVFYPISSSFPSGVTGFNVYELARILNGTFTNPALTLDPGDQETREDDWLWINGEFFKVDSIDNQRVATLVIPNANGSTPPDGQYVRPISADGRVVDFMELAPTASTSGNWDANLLTRVPLVFPGQSPEEQRARAFRIASGNRPEVVVLEERFQPRPAGPVTFFVDAAFGEWQRDVDNTTTNPELSWEYWNGKGWWTLPVTRDDTQNLKLTGALKFRVPSDIAASDWAGKTNFWIRARLVGGDYGREKVTVKTTPDGSGGTVQTVDRSLKDIRAPQVLNLHIAYAGCEPTPPTFVFAQDSGTIRDQSQANRTAGAVVEAFVPLAETLGRLSNSAASRQASGDCPPECTDDQPRQPTPIQALSGRAASPAPSEAIGRALFIGLAATPSEAPVNVLLLVDEREFAAFAPMTISALVADHLVPIVADDTTRALGESGLLSMAFADPPTRSELFGQKNLTWLRIGPKTGANAANWKPSLRGAYLNAAWANATETLTRELLGSSDGEPNKVVRLARPPVLDGTLELRVKEPLGEEERDTLHKAGTANIVREVDRRTGAWIDWVLWKQVTDPDDEPASARVYALDERTGEIRFGNGLHGRIPPIGRDSIVAFSYKRTEPDASGNAGAPGNLIAARTALNLVSPVEKVESVIAAEQAAGGAPPENDERVLQFGYARLRHRNRAITLRDLEDMTLESSPDIAQTLALVRRTGVRLVIVMRGNNPLPGAAQRRELHRYLVARAPTSLSTPDALRIEGPKIRRLRVELELRVETLDHAGELAAFIKQGLAGFFDTASGGVAKTGWPLGANPSEDDIAFALGDAPYLDSIKRVTLHEITVESSPRPWPDTLKPTELVVLADDPIRIQFESAEVTP